MRETTWDDTDEDEEDLAPGAEAAESESEDEDAGVFLQQLSNGVESTRKMLIDGLTPSHAYVARPGPPGASPLFLCVSFLFHRKAMGSSFGSVLLCYMARNVFGGTCTVSSSWGPWGYSPSRTELGACSFGCSLLYILTATHSKTGTPLWIFVRLRCLD